MRKLCLLIIVFFLFQFSYASVSESDNLKVDFVIKPSQLSSSDNIKVNYVINPTARNDTKGFIYSLEQGTLTITERMLAGFWKAPEFIKSQIQRLDWYSGFFIVLMLFFFWILFWKRKKEKKSNESSQADEENPKADISNKNYFSYYILFL